MKRTEMKACNFTPWYTWVKGRREALTTSIIYNTISLLFLLFPPLNQSPRVYYYYYYQY